MRHGQSSALAHHIGNILRPLIELHSQRCQDGHDGGIVTRVCVQHSCALAACAGRHPLHNLQHAACMISLWSLYKLRQ